MLQEATHCEHEQNLLKVLGILFLLVLDQNTTAKCLNVDVCVENAGINFNSTVSWADFRRQKWRHNGRCTQFQYKIEDSLDLQIRTFSGNLILLDISEKNEFSKHTFILHLYSLKIQCDNSYRLQMYQLVKNRNNVVHPTE